MKVNIIKIEGNWDLGYVLDQHSISSEPDGEYESGRTKFKTARTELGEALFQLKYRSNFNFVDPIADTLIKHLGYAFKSTDFVIPMPPSKTRYKQPVQEIAKAVAHRMSKPYLEGLLVKNGTTLQMKDITGKENKMAALLECFSVEDVLDEGEHDILLIDDLYSSGASIEAACDVLREYENIGNLYVAAITRTK